MRLFEDIIDKVSQDDSTETSSSSIVSRDDDSKIREVNDLEDFSPKYKYVVIISKELDAAYKKEAERLYDIIDTSRFVEEVGPAEYCRVEDIGRLFIKISFNIRTASETDIFYLLKTLIRINNSFFLTKTRPRRTMRFGINGFDENNDIIKSFDMND